MSKNRRPSIKVVQSWIDKGHGQGERKNYRPFFFVRDVPSAGRSSMVLGLKTGRVHHYLSDVEFLHHVLAEFSPEIVDIREQYALLPWEETQEIAQQLGFKHPMYPGTSTPTVMTSDIVLTTTTDSLLVVSIKRASDIAQRNVRTLQKLRIEQEYWNRRGVKWKLSTEDDISIVRAKNLSMLRTSMVSKELDWLAPYIKEFVHYFIKRWDSGKKLCQILTEVGAIMRLATEKCFCLFGRAVWLRLLPVNLETQIDHFSPISIVLA